jgi:hypothetical protein
MGLAARRNRAADAPSWSKVSLLVLRVPHPKVRDRSIETFVRRQVMRTSKQVLLELQRAGILVLILNARKRRLLAWFASKSTRVSTARKVRRTTTSLTADGTYCTLNPWLEWS